MIEEFHRFCIYKIYTWEDRTEQIAQLIQPGSSVLEFGADRMLLKKYLPEGCVYTPSDIIDRGCNTIICDLNADNLPDFPYHDVAIFSGVLEYICDIDRLISHLSKIVPKIITSYAVNDYPRLEKDFRKIQGWVNDYSRSEFKNIFLENGFCCDKIVRWEMQEIFVFNRCL